MSDFVKCLSTALRDGLLKEPEFDALKATYDRVHKATGKAETATAEVLEILTQDRIRAAKQAKLDADIAIRLKRELLDFKSGTGHRDAGEFLQAKIEYHGEGKGIASSVETTRKQILADALSMMEDVLWHFRQGSFGRRVNKADQRNLVKEVFGGDTGDAAAKAMAKAWNETAEYMRLRFNRAGGDIPKLENWGLPQTWNKRAIANFIAEQGRPAFKKRIFDGLAIDKIRDLDSGRQLSSAEIFDALDGVIDNMLTDGHISLDPSRAPKGKGKLGNQRRDGRFLHFRDAETWLDIQKEFGAGDPFGAMMSHLSMMSRDIAALEELGSNPPATLAWLEQIALQEAAKRDLGRPSLVTKVKAGRAAPYVQRKIHAARVNWEHYTGGVNSPVSEFWADVGGNTRNVMTGAILGTATLAAVPTDVVFSTMARAYTTGQHGNFVKAFVGELTSRLSRREAVQMGAGLDSAMSVFGEQARYAGTFAGQAWSNVLASQSLAVTGLTSWTRAGRHGFFVGALMDFGNLSDRNLVDLPDPVQRFFERYAVSEGDWDTIRTLPKIDNGAPDFAALRGSGPDGERLATRFLAAVQADGEFAVPSGTIRARSLLIGNSRPGTASGEFRRSAAMFMSFGVTLALTHGRRYHAMFAGGHAAKGASYASAMLMTLAFGGAVAIQLKQIAGGKDPRDMTDPDFWKAASLQGGGLGIWGDFFFADLNRFGGSIPMTAGGPGVGLVNDLREGVLGNLAKGDFQGMAQDMTGLGGRMVPGSNTWYLKAAWDRLVEDNLRRLTDPDAEAAFRRRERSAQRDYGQKYFWAPGDMAPERAPDLAAALGEGG